VRIRRDEAGVVVALGSGERVRYDKVVVATHADEALALLPTRRRPSERCSAGSLFDERHGAPHRRDRDAGHPTGVGVVELRSGRLP